MLEGTIPKLRNIHSTSTEDGDMEAVLERYISIGKIRNTVLGAQGRSGEPENTLF